MRELLVRITGDATSLRRTLASASGDVDRFQGRVEGTDRSLRGLAQYGMAGALLGATLLVGGLTAAGAAAVTFDANMRNVQSITKQTDESLADLNDQVLDLASGGLPARAGELSEGLYDIASSGFQGAAGLKVLEESAKAASAGMTTTETAAGAITASLNAYGLGAGEASDVSDILFRTVDQGVLTFEDLSRAIGFTVGTAASAKIPLEDLSAALATITLSGLKGEIASGSLAALIRSVATPGKELAKVYQQLGYESGEAALAQLGLKGVVELVGDATGGSLSGLQSLLVSVESVRGAAALLADSGATYDRVAGQITDADARMGATQAALDEQAKSTRFQYQQLVAAFEAGSIRVGVTVLPVFNGLLAAMLDIVQQGGPALLDFMGRLEPTFAALYGAGVNVVSILGELYQVVAPAAGALGTLAATGAVATLQALALVVEGATGFLAEHEAVVVAVGAVYLASLLPPLSVVATTLSVTMWRAIGQVVVGLVAMESGAYRGAAALRTLAASAAAFNAAATAGIAVAIFALVRGFQQIEQASAAAEDRVGESLEGINAADMSAVTGALDALRGDMQESADTYAALQEKWSNPIDFRVNAGINAAFGDGSVAEAATAGEAAAKAYERLNQQAMNATANVEMLSRQTGVSRDTLRELAVANDIDLGKPYRDSQADRDELLVFLDSVKDRTGVDAASLLPDLEGDMAALEELAKATEEFQKQVGDAFAGATDVVSTWEPDIGVEELESATDRVALAQERLQMAKERMSETDESSAAAARDIAAAEGELAEARASSGEGVAQRVADAEAKVADVRQRYGDAAVDGAKAVADAETELADARAAALEAEAAAQEGTLSGFYAARIAQAQEFSDGITEALARGLDPAYVQRLMQQGPEAAGPILQEILSDSSGTLIDMVNTSEAELSRLNLVVVEQARLTQLAISSSNDQMTRDLATAMEISRVVLTAEGEITAEEIAKSLEIPVSEAQRIGQNFGITFMSSAQAAINARNLDGPKVTNWARPSAGGSQGTGPARRVATGGYITGQGTGTSDSVRALLSHGEYVQPAATVGYYGVDFMERLRTRRLPRFADGGMVGRQPATQVVTVPVTHTSETRAPIYVDKIITPDVDSFRRDSLARSTRGAAE